jgi:hypothetical protein
LALDSARERFDAIAAALKREASPGAIRTGFAQLRDHEAAKGLITRADDELIRTPR